MGPNEIRSTRIATSLRGTSPMKAKPERIKVDWNDQLCQVNMWNQYLWGMITLQSLSHMLLHPHLLPKKDK
eukprot:12926828-Ditylum_brightwellii.AAC.1